MVDIFRFPGEKYHSIDTTQDALLMVRLITNQKLKPIYFREYRPHLMAENIQFELPYESVSLHYLKSKIWRDVHFNYHE